ncbi:Actin cytoskeleton-regulatory complex protein END3 [Hondaea fermentalgiana]|uniref:Actin cytoskeleton-regulatory complex protein END3 n=1 Tax=Hondaea fermentalgiana TaxID=2315210 RepID=A0A2R5G0B4_9STRA|nr:Actin cytoskeleton-regulatory complex protein END3 [Hondaea fermentalgiana]|eukprot:GBG24476.1 Actin cytoskeleton-regulatory complex protein END3 [Hondaea fermentalgiana]
MRPFKKSKSKRDAKSTNAAVTGSAAASYKPGAAIKAKKLGLNEEEDSRVITALSPLLAYLRSRALDTENLFMITGGSNPDADLYTFQIAAKNLLRSRDGLDAVFAEFNEHVWANVVKLFLKEMSRPLIPNHICEIFLSRDYGQPGPGHVAPEVVRMVKEIVEDVPHKEFAALRDLCAVLRDCMTDQDRLAHMFGAILLAPPDTTGFAPDPQVMIKQAQNTTIVMKSLIGSATEIFGVDPPMRAKPEGHFLTMQSLHQGSPEENGSGSGSNGSGASRARIGSFDLSSSGNQIPGQAFPAAAAAAAHPATVGGAGQGGRVSRFVTALYEHVPEEDDELYLCEGDQIKVIGQVNQDWYKGLKTHPDGRTEVGIFPGSYCGLQGTEEFEEPLDSDTAANHAAATTNGTSSVIDLAAAASADLSRASHVMALYNYEPREQTEMAITAGQRIRLIEASDPDWWFGASEDGREGLFPRTYVGPAPGATMRGEAPPSHAVQGNSKPAVIGNLLVASSPSANPALAQPSHSAAAPVPPRRTTSLQNPSPHVAFKMQPTQHVNSPTAQGNKSWLVDKARFDLCRKNFEKQSRDSPDGRVPGHVASSFLERSKLSRGTISRVLELADLDRDGSLNLLEFVIAHHLTISISRDRMDEPSVLPSGLIPSIQRHM